MRSVQTIDEKFCDSLLYFGSYQLSPSIRILQNYLQDSYGPLILPVSYESQNCSNLWRRLYPAEGEKITRLVVYFSMNYFIPNDTTWSKIINSTTSICYKPILIDNLDTQPNILNVFRGTEISSYAPLFVNTSKIEIIQGFTWLHINNMQLTSDGIIYLTIEFARIDAPTSSQIRNGLNCTGGAAMNSTRVTYEVAYMNTYNYTFANLERETSYTIYFTASNEIPFDSYQILNPVNRSTTTILYSYTSAALLLFSLALLAAALLVAF